MKTKGIFVLLSVMNIFACVIYYKYSSSYVGKYFKGQTESMKNNSYPVYRTQFPTKPLKQEQGRFHVILTFRLMNITNKNESARMNEYVYCLKSFLNNPHVKQVHLMHKSPEMPGYIQEKVGAHPKLMLHLVDDPDVVLTLHEFAFTHLQGEEVLITQADIILGEGFDKVKKSILVKKKLFYSLSRRGEKTCPNAGDSCAKYIGSHDTFVFVPKGSISAKGKALLSHLIYSWGTESIVMHVYATLGYKVLNPCWVIKVYHHHCSGFRNYTKKQIRVNSKMPRMSRPTRLLV